MPTNCESQLLKNSNESELDTEDLRRKLCQANKEKLDLTIKHNQEVRTFLFVLFYSWNKCSLVSVK